MKLSRNLIGYLAILACAALVFYSAANNWGAATIAMDDPLLKVTNVLLTFLIIATLLERSVTVFSHIIFRDNITNKRENYRNKLTAAKASARYFGIANSGSVHDLQSTKRDLEITKKENTWIKLCLVFLLSVLIAASGFQILGNFLGSAGGSSQSVLFIAMDVLLSAGLIAGGSQGIVQIIELFQNYKDESFTDRQAERLAPSQKEATVPGHGHPGSPQMSVSQAAATTDISWLGNNQNPSSSIVPYADSTTAFASLSSTSTDHDDSAAYLETRSEQTSDIVLRPFGSWIVAKSLNKLREQINTQYPNRNKASDGTIGDTRHCPGTSDHCPNSDNVVTAFDCTHDPDNGCDVDLITEEIRLSQDSRIKYVIYNRKIFSSYPNNGIPPWTWRPYSGSNPHVKHAHFSVLGDPSKYNDESEWTIEPTGEQSCLLS